jgi:orotate phosphoribosyltransferase
MDAAVKKDFAARTAGHLLDIGAVHFNTEKPFTLTSGRVSPVYIDCRKLISFLEPRRDIIRMACEILSGACDTGKIDYVAGGETAGIAYAAWISEALGKPMLYVRKKPKGFGRGAQIEGDMKEGARVLLVEDLTTDGGSKAAFAGALRDGGAVVTNVFSVFFYGIYGESRKILADAGLTLHALATWRDVLQAARQRQLFPAEVFSEVEKFFADADAWSQEHGGVGPRMSAV